MSLLEVLCSVWIISMVGGLGITLWNANTRLLNESRQLRWADDAADSYAECVLATHTVDACAPQDVDASVYQDVYQVDISMSIGERRQSLELITLDPQLVAPETDHAGS